MNAKKTIKFFLWIFIILILIFHKWFIATIVTPIRCAALGNDAIKIYLPSDEWKGLRIAVNKHSIKYDHYKDNNQWISYRDLSENDKLYYKEKISYEGVDYSLISINKLNDISLYFSNKEKFLTEIFYKLYYDSLIDKVILSSVDIYGVYPSYLPLTDGYSTIGCTKNETNNNSYKSDALIQNYRLK